ncbi:MAG TPA: DUF3048 domain-containing protein [Ilumatobacter sp.]|nr:DUF3048 domain-containing protein [Ilumatobacter sp.]
MNRSKSALLLAAVTATAVAACGGGSDATPTTTAETVPTATSAPATTDRATTTTSTTLKPIVTSTTVPDVLRVPLTGEPIDDASQIPDRPAVAVKMPVDRRAQPWSGLNNADIVFETIINGGFTRLIAMFHSDGADPVGPIRSGRAQDIDVISMFREPLVGWSGGNPSVTREMRIADDELNVLVDLNAVRGHSDLYYRRSGVALSPNNLYSSTDVLLTATPEVYAPPTPVFPYLKPGEEPIGEPATEIEVTLDDISSEWEYDPETERYFRSQNGFTSITETGAADEQVWADNVVVMMADYGINPLDNNPDLQSRGSNPLLVFSKGTVREGVWVRFETVDPFAFFDNLDDLNAVGLVPGRTWVEFPRNEAGNVEFS